MEPVKVAAVQAAPVLLDRNGLCVDTSPRPAVIETPRSALGGLR
jgi:hypothetical protein